MSCERLERDQHSSISGVGTPSTYSSPPVLNDAFPQADVQSLRGFHLRHRVHDRMSFWAVSDLNQAELIQFCEALEE